MEAQWLKAIALWPIYTGFGSDTYTKTKNCISCIDNCATCTDSPDRCSTCEPHLVLHNGTCATECPAGYFSNNLRRCINCHEACGVCNGPGIDNCTENNTRSKMYDVTSCSNVGSASVTETCRPQCSSGYVGEDGGCMPCWPGCTECWGGLSWQCRMCQRGLRLTAGGQCLPVRCPPKSYPRRNLHLGRSYSETSSGCSSCHRLCATCNSGGPYGCTSCILGRYLDNATGICLPCHQNCTTCKGPNHDQCISCSQPGALPVGGRCYAPNECSDCAQTEFYRNIVQSRQAQVGIAGPRPIKLESQGMMATQDVIREGCLFQDEKGGGTRSVQLEDTEGQYFVAYEEGSQNEESPPWWLAAAASAITLVALCLFMYIITIIIRTIRSCQVNGKNISCGEPAPKGSPVCISNGQYDRHIIFDAYDTQALIPFT
ncbi:hypothetical protein AAG570_009531 [Ranatra chinensis]|uniref:Uncharacterized protein n=1 Tax=Ranatra chinensis TaxID=642074 RepID=A0ABD0YPC4_9HEMI